MKRIKLFGKIFTRVVETPQKRATLAFITGIVIAAIVH